MFPCCHPKRVLSGRSSAITRPSHLVCRRAASSSSSSSSSPSSSALQTEASPAGTSTGQNAGPKRYVDLRHVKVSTTWNIPKQRLLLDVLFNNGRGMLLEPARMDLADRLSGSPLRAMYSQQRLRRLLSGAPPGGSPGGSSSASVLDDLARYRRRRHAARAAHPNYHPFFSPAASPAPAGTLRAHPLLITHSAVCQLPLENNALFNLPAPLLHHLSLSLRSGPSGPSPKNGPSALSPHNGPSALSPHNGPSPPSPKKTPSAPSQSIPSGPSGPSTALQQDVGRELYRDDRLVVGRIRIDEKIARQREKEGNGKEQEKENEARCAREKE